MQNSILFDFGSLIDREISVIKFLAGEYRETALLEFDKHRVLYTSDLDWKISRTSDKEDTFKSLMVEDSLKKESETVLSSLWESYEDIIIKKYAFPTDIKSLISAYKQAGGGGIIKMSVYCDNDTQKEYVTKHFPFMNIETGGRDKVDLKKYNRIMVGFYKDALKYTYPGPKSILVLNLRENFSDNDITILNPELVIKLGDIHDIEVASAYRIISETK